MPLKILTLQKQTTISLPYADARIKIAPRSAHRSDRAKRCAVGDAVLLRKIISTAPYTIASVAPLYLGGLLGEEQKLRSCFIHALELAKQHKFESVIFSALPRDRFSFPEEKRIRIAVSAIGGWLTENEADMDIYLLSEPPSEERKSFARLQTFIANRYVHSRDERFYSPSSSPAAQQTDSRSDADSATYEKIPLDDTGSYDAVKPFILTETEECFDDFSVSCTAPDEWYLSDGGADVESFSISCETRKPASRRLEDVLGQVGESFSQMLFRLIDQRGLTDPQVYKRANIDRRLFSKIRSNPNYQPAKSTVLALAIALELNLDQTTDLLRRAGFALSPSSKSDLIVEFFIREKQFNIHEVNEALFSFKQKLLGA